ASPGDYTTARIMSNYRKPASSSSSQPVSVGQVAPEDATAVAVAGGSLQEVSLRTYRLSHSYLLLLFLPTHGPAVDRLSDSGSDLFDEFHAVSADMVKELHDQHKTYVVGVVDASVDQVQRWMDTPASRGGLQELPFPVICDGAGRFSCHFAGVWNAKAELLHRAHVILDDKGVVRQLTINDAMVSRSVGELYRQLTAFRFTDEHGEVCPADWNSGDAGLAPDPEASRAYFREKYPTEAAESGDKK
ncbi:hypothetical protein BOX15_Mlig020987g1, partial [Macrostomum lignano]